jgi:dolichol-phosphate mannosyltransferase
LLAAFITFSVASLKADSNPEIAFAAAACSRADGLFGRIALPTCRFLILAASGGRFLMAERIVVCTATYNEAENLPMLARAVRATLPHADFLVIDDHSPDGTGRIADELAQADPQIHVIHRTGKLGLGTAIIRAMEFAIENGYDLIVNMDADFSHDPKYLPAMISGGPRCDVMIGSRYVPGGGVENWPWQRQLISNLVNLLSRVLLRLPARDNSGGYRCYRVDLLRRINLRDIWSKGYSFQEEVLYRCVRAGAKVRETPIVFADRRRGQSKVNVHEAVRSLGLLLLLGLKDLTDG